MSLQPLPQLLQELFGFRPIPKSQQHAVTVLNQIWEEGFLGFSYGFRPGHGQHQSLTILSSSAAIPNGRCLPSSFGIQTRRDGFA